jgi:pimeloyl-ACP methyl ester carboxylesterase
MERNITIKSGQWDLSATLHYPQGKQQANELTRVPIIIICHGFVGSRVGTNRLFVNAARLLSDQGYMVLRFDYIGCGESTGDYGATSLEKLVEQTRYVLDYVLDIDVVDPDQVIVLGHSLGAAVAILTAAKDRRVKSLILWAPVAHPFKDIVSITGRHIYDDALANGSADYLGYSFTPTFFNSLLENHPFQEIVKFSGDVLLIHGTSDDVIPVDYSFLYQKVAWTRSEGQCDKEIIHQADHTFSSKHSVARLYGRTIEWLYELKKRRKEWNGWTI